MGKRFHIETGQHTNGEMQLIYDNEGLDDYYFINDEIDFKDLCNLLNELHEENEANKKTICDLTNQLKFHKKMHCEYKKDAEQLKSVLQDLGLLHSDEEVLEIREQLSEKLLKPLFEANNIDVDIDIGQGFTITPKKQWKD